MFKATNVKVHVGYGYYVADVSYKYSETGKSYLRYDFSSPTSMIELIDFTEGTRSKVCSSCETGFYPYGLPLLFGQSSDIPTKDEDGECKEYTPASTSNAVLSLWYKDNGDLCKVVLEDGRTLDFSAATVDKQFKDETVFNLEGKECPAPVCKRIMDVVFVIDSSGSVDADNWATIKDFLRAVVGSFEIGPDATMVGIVSYGKEAHQVIGLSGDASDIENAIENARYCAGTTCTGCGIELGLDILNSTTEARDSLDPEKIMMVLTDGENNEIDRQMFCREYEPVCTQRGENCARYKCNGNMVKKNTSICARYEDTDVCLKYRCTKCSKYGDCYKYRDKCEKWSSTKCLKYSSTICEGNPSTYCCTYQSDGSVKNKTGCGRCDCNEYRCESYACEKYSCAQYNCDVCTKYSTTGCIAYKQKCAEYMQVEVCDGDEVCEEKECIAGTIQCKEYDLGANSYLAGAVSKVRTQWALYPKSKRTPIIFAIGVKGANEQELKGIGSTVNGEQFVYKVNEFTDLFGIINRLVEETCTKQTASLEGCSADCLGFCGCNKECYCPTCEDPTGQCYSFSCKNDTTTSTGCVPHHMSCEAKDMCHTVTPDNNTEGCCRQDPINCVKTDDQCVIYGCNAKTGCTVETRVCVPESACFNLTGCDNRTGCNFVSACPDLGPCKLSTCVVTNEEKKEFTCTYADKCKSDDPCKLPVCNEETGECSLVDMVCEPKDPCNYARCYDGRCIEDVNITKKIECANQANSSCWQGYCDSKTGQCAFEEILTIENCKACEENDTLDCPSLNTGCKTYKCAPVDTFSDLTQCVEDINTCPDSLDPCIVKSCTDEGECISSDIKCAPAEDVCHSTRCVPDPNNPRQHMCETISTFVHEDNACFKSTCGPNGEEIRVNQCPEIPCKILRGCELNEDDTAGCIYDDVVCPSESCLAGVCNPKTGMCEQLDNSSNCDPHNPCVEYECRKDFGCIYKNITCDDDDNCTIDSCVPLDGSDSDSEGATSSSDSNGYVCRHVPKCTTTNFCDRVSCNVHGTCTWVQYDCDDLKKNSTLDDCHTYKCDESTRTCKVVLRESAFLGVCGDCIKASERNSTNSESIKNKCVAGMKLPDFAATIGGAAVAGIVIAAIIVAAAIGVSSTIGTKELIKRARKNADAGTNTNPLYEGNENEFNNPTFMDNGDKE